MVAYVFAFAYAQEPSWWQSPAYRDFAMRVEAAVPNNSIAALMLLDSLRNRDSDAGKIIAILEDHRNRTSGLDSYRAGRHSITFKGEGTGTLGLSNLVERFSGADANVGIGLDFELVRHSGDLVSTSGRVAAQTGYDYVIGDAQLVPKACGSLTGGITAPAFRLGEADLEAAGALCYEYNPSAMTGLASYVARNQDRLTRLEKTGGDDLLYLTDLLFNYYDSGCAGATGVVGCEKVGSFLTDLESAGLGLDLPKTIRTAEEIRESILENPEIALLLEDNDTTRARIQELEDLVGRKLTDSEAALLDLARSVKGLDASFSNTEIALIRQGRILEYLADPEVQENLMVNAMGAAQNKLKLQQRAYQNALRDSNYASLTDDEKKAKFALELKSLDEDHQTFGLYSKAAENSLLLIGSLSNSSSFQGHVRRGFAVINSASEIIHSGRALALAFSGNQLTSPESILAYSNGITASLALISVFSNAGGKSELEQVIDYLGQRLDNIDKKLDYLIDISIAIDQKIDVLLAGQQAISEQLRTNAQAIAANRTESRLVRIAVSDLSNQLQELGMGIGRRSDEAEAHRRAIFNTEVRIQQEGALRNVNQIFGSWLNPDTKIIERLNSGDATTELLDNVRFQRQAVLALLYDLSGQTFVLPPDVLANDSRRFERPPVYAMSMLPQEARTVAEISNYARENRQPDSRLVSHYSVEENNKRDQEILRLHNSAYPDINDQAFTALPNPDALLYILERYLTFVFALNETAREKIGFSDLPEIAKMIERLSESKRVAQAASFVALSAMLESLDVISSDFEAQLGTGRLFAQYNDELSDYIFQPSSLLSPDAMSNGGEADAFVQEVSGNAVALDWLLAHGNPYLTRGLNVDGKLTLEMIKRIRTDPALWRLTANLPDEPWIGRLSAAELEHLNLQLLSDIRGLYEAYLEGELFEYSDEELVFFDEFVQKPILLITDDDIAKFVSLIKSDLEMLKFAEAENLIHLVLELSNEQVDVNSDSPDPARHYAEVKYINFGAAGTCRGVEIQPLPGAEAFGVKLEKYGFPLNESTYTTSDGRIPGPSLFSLRRGDEFMNRVIDCQQISIRDPFKIIHSSPAAETFPIIDYFNMATTSPIPWRSNEPHTNESWFLANEFVREKSIRPDGSKLLHEGYAKCKLAAKWVGVQYIGLPGVEQDAAIGIAANYVVHMLEQPTLFASEREVKLLTDALYTDQNTPLTEDYDMTCSYSDQTVKFNVHPGEKPVLGKPHFPVIAAHGWEFLGNSQLSLVPNFRTGVTSILQKRRASATPEKLERIARSFREPSTLVNFVLVRMELGLGVSGFYEIRDDIIQAYRNDGYPGFFAHPSVSQFLQERPQEREDVAELKRFLDSRKQQPALLQAFAEWGLGTCLFDVSEYRDIFGIIYDPLAGSDVTLLDAMRILGDPEQSNQYALAIEAIQKASSEVKERLEALENFPPEPRWPDQYLFYSVPAYAIDHDSALNYAQSVNCTLGHPSIVELEMLHDLVTRAELLD